MNISNIWKISRKAFVVQRWLAIQPSDNLHSCKVVGRHRAYSSGSCWRKPCYVYWSHVQFTQSPWPASGKWNLPVARCSCHLGESIYGGCGRSNNSPMPCVEVLCSWAADKDLFERCQSFATYVVHGFVESRRCKTITRYRDILQQIVRVWSYSRRRRRNDRSTATAWTSSLQGKQSSEHCYLRIITPSPGGSPASLLILGPRRPWEVSHGGLHDVEAISSWAVRPRHKLLCPWSRMMVVGHEKNRRLISPVPVERFLYFKFCIWKKGLGMYPS